MPDASRGEGGKGSRHNVRSRAPRSANGDTIAITLLSTLRADTPIQTAKHINRKSSSTLASAILAAVALMPPLPRILSVVNGERQHKRAKSVSGIHHDPNDGLKCPN